MFKPIVRSLTLDEIAEIVDWAERQVYKAPYSHTNEPEKEIILLRGNFYLSATLPNFKGISVFNLPSFK